MHYYVYIVRNLLTDEFYIGKRKSSKLPELDTGYMGGGGRDGYRLTAEQRHRISQSHLNLGKKISQEQREVIRSANLGNQNAVGNTARLGRPHSQESRRKMSEAMRGNQNGRGVVFSDERRKRISEALRGNRNGRKK